MFGIIWIHFNFLPTPKRGTRLYFLRKPWRTGRFSYLWFVLYSHKRLSLHTQTNRRGKVAESQNTYILILRLTEHPTPTLVRWHRPDDLGKSCSGLLHQAYLVATRPLEEMLNFINLSILWLLAFLITYLFITHYYLHTMLQSLRVQLFILDTFLWNTKNISIFNFTLSAGAEEYTDCTFAEG